MNIAETLEGAADILARDGWIQRQCDDDQGRHCLIDAMWTANEDTWSKTQAYLEGQLGGVSVIWWNDLPERTADEVIAKLREGAENWRKLNPEVTA